MNYHCDYSCAKHLKAKRYVITAFQNLRIAPLLKSSPQQNSERRTKEQKKINPTPTFSPLYTPLNS
ncbi:MAG: hypothetical protein IJ352_10465 [Muribaculaceae bacterium]|nr:hypothetical protein [Muribaculaceae bacterium]